MAKVCIIGAGLSGLTSIKACLEEDLTPVCYETCKDLGGLWNVEESKMRKDGAKIYPSLVSNISKEMTAFSDFPMPKTCPMYPTWKDMHSYLDIYARNFGLREHIHFEHKVTNVEEIHVQEKCKWQVTVKSKSTGKEFNKIFDKVIVGVGEYNRMFVPRIPGEESFCGQMLHMSEFKSKEEFTGKNVVIVGAGNTGCDVAIDIGNVAMQLYLSTRHGHYIISRTRKGWPFEMVDLTRIKIIAQKFLPSFLINRMLKSNFNQVFDHEVYGIKSCYDPTNPQADLVINDGLHFSISCGKVVVVPGIDHIQGSLVHLVNGKVLHDIDVILFATGYQHSFPFISDKHLPDDISAIKMFKSMFPLDVTEPGTLALVGANPFAGEARTITSEMQARYVTSVFAGVHRLPSKDEMLKEQQETYKYFTKSGNFIYKFPLQVYTPNLAKDIGVYPYFFTLLFRDPQLAFRILFGPPAAYIYRIVGRNNCPEMRQRILDIWENTSNSLNQL